MSLGRQWDKRLEIWNDTLDTCVYLPLGEVHTEGFTTFLQLSLEQAKKESFTPFPVASSWGEKWEYGWFRGTVTLPIEAAGKEIVLRLGVAQEMLVFVNGQEAGSIDKKHDFVTLTQKGKEGEVFEIYAEAYGGHGPRLEKGGCCGRGEIPVPEPECPQVTVAKSHFGIWDEEVFQVVVQYHTLYELWKALPGEDLVAMKIAKGLQEFTYIADLEQDYARRRSSILQAGQILAPILEWKNGSQMPKFTVFGQSHLDLAWLWPWEETKRKCARTYANQLALAERYPEYKFLLCEPPILENLKTHYPALYKRVQEKVTAGQFIPEGAVWIEGDTNMAGGESLIRQFVKGKQWFFQEFGIDSQMAWMPDTFGFSGALPQIMKGCRVPYFATQKLLRCDPECEQFPYNIFWWEGVDGSRILSHIYKKNNAVFSPAALVERWQQDRNQKENIESMLFPFGYGDGGGGPTREMVEKANLCKDLQGAPRCEMESPVKFFEKLNPESIENVYYGELYLAWHRGTYTAQGAIKKSMRQGEAAIRQAEYLAGLLRLQGESIEEESPLLEELWEKLLFCQFHDILPGTSIARVHQEAREQLQEVVKKSNILSEKLLTRLAKAPVAFNSLSFPRKWNGITLPPCGYAPLQKVEEIGEQGTSQKQEKDFCVLTQQVDGTYHVDTPLYQARVNTQGEVTSLKLLSSGFEYAEHGLNHLALYQDVNVDYDAWELGRMYEKAPVPMIENGTLEKTAPNTLVITRKEEYFTLKQELHFHTDSPQIDFVTTVDWRERHRILKAEFPTTVFTREVLQETQFGYVKRPTHKSRQYEQDLYETCQHRYSLLTDGENGFALLNDGKYGISAKNGKLGLSLLRAPVFPDGEADQGSHRFTYSIFLFQGANFQNKAVQAAAMLNTPVAETKTEGYPKKVEPVSFFQVSHPAVVLETCKPGFDNNEVVLRLYESMGSSVVTEISLPSQVEEVYLTNLLEEKEEKLILNQGKVTLRFGSFEIKTLSLILKQTRREG